ncbi:MAG: hypothetical protein M3168_05150 [Actinomycetota bacterium]|nr:hypothetical protein [Actinomycetota bacterium]
MTRAVLLAALLGLTMGCTHTDDPAPTEAEMAPAAGLAKRGRPTRSSPEMTAQLESSELGGGRIFLLGEISGRHFYRVESVRAGTCFSVGDGVRLEATECATGEFPSAQQPVLDLSVVELSTPDAARVVRLEGLAADRVDTIRLVNASGAVIATTPVVENLYALTVVPDRPVVALVARDASGRQLARISYVGGA